MVAGTEPNSFLYRYGSFHPLHLLESGYPHLEFLFDSRVPCALLHGGQVGKGQIGLAGFVHIATRQTSQEWLTAQIGCLFVKLGRIVVILEKISVVEAEEKGELIIPVPVFHPVLQEGSSLP